MGRWHQRLGDTVALKEFPRATGLNSNDLQLQARVNGAVVQSQHTSDLIFDVATIVSYMSSCVTLLLDDIISAGAPGSAAWPSARLVAFTIE